MSLLGRGAACGILSARTRQDSAVMDSLGQRFAGSLKRLSAPSLLCQLSDARSSTFSKRGSRLPGSWGLSQPQRAICRCQSSVDKRSSGLCESRASCRLRKSRRVRGRFRGGFGRSDPPSQRSQSRKLAEGLQKVSPWQARLMRFRRHLTIAKQIA